MTKGFNFPKHWRVEDYPRFVEVKRAEEGYQRSKRGLLWVGIILSLIFGIPAIYTLILGG